MDEKFFISLPEYTREEVRENDYLYWIIINDLVYDLTEFIHIHPGGYEVLLEYMGFDATSVFEDVGHSTMAKTVMLQYVVGRLTSKKISLCRSIHTNAPPVIAENTTTAEFKLCKK